MSQKYKLMQDTEDDRPSASIRRHLTVAAILVIIPIITLVVLSVFFFGSAAQKYALREAELQEARATQAAMPTRTPRPTSTPIPPPMVSRATAMRTGPAMRYDTIGTLEAGDPVTIVGRDTISKWYLLDNGYWIEAWAVDNAPRDIPFVSP